MNNPVCFHHLYLFSLKGPSFFSPFSFINVFTEFGENDWQGPLYKKKTQFCPLFAHKSTCLFFKISFACLSTCAECRADLIIYLNQSVVEESARLCLVGLEWVELFGQCLSWKEMNVDGYISVSERMKRGKMLFRENLTDYWRLFEVFMNIVNRCLKCKWK